MTAEINAAADALHRTVPTRYGQMVLFANDSGAATRSLVAYGEWAENEISFLKRMIAPGSTVVDVGAYVGTHTLAFAQFVGGHGRVIAIEPQQWSFELLARNVAANQLANVNLEHAAAVAERGTIQIRSIDPRRQSNFGSVSLQSPADQCRGTTENGSDAFEQRGITVEGLTIDSLDLPSCSLIKIDAEGSENLVIRGAEHTLRRFRPVIYAECNSVENGLKTIRLLRRLGFVLRLHVVDAFNEGNFLRNKRNIFNSAREVAIVGLSGPHLDSIDNGQARKCELILNLESADDLVLGMLNKPQYPTEILSISAAARNGGNGWFYGTRQIEHERIANELAEAKNELARMHERADTLEVERQRIANELVWTRQELERMHARQRIANELAWTRQELGRMHERADTLEVERQRTANELALARQELEKTHERADTLDSSAGGSPPSSPE